MTTTENKATVPEDSCDNEHTEAELSLAECIIDCFPVFSVMTKAELAALLKRGGMSPVDLPVE